MKPVLLAVFLLASLLSLPWAGEASAMPPVLDVVGHGFGHGRGMGQYGAEGYAAAGWSWRQIVSYYYGGTTIASVPEGDISVHLSELDGAPGVSVSAPAGDTLLVNNRPVASPATVNRSGTDQTITVSNGGDVTVAGPWGGRQFAGAIVVKASPAQVWNVLPVEQYVDGVVPREMPAGWPAAALEAQAVAARSYALAYGTPICDTTMCQVYGGDPSQYSSYWAGVSNAAVAATAGQVVECGGDSQCGQPSQIASTEYSASTGGWTAGGVFGAVADAGDSVGNNPYHSWSTTVDASSITAAWPSLGVLQSVVVTSRDGQGDLGGRVLEMSLTGTGGHITVTGSQFAGAVGLDSDWFAFTDAAPPPGSDTGYWVAGSDGSVMPFGSAPSYGSMAGHGLTAPIIGMAPTGNGGGYWMVAADGGIFSFGDAGFHGSTGAMRLSEPVVGMASSPSGLGYWLVASDGGIFSFGDARFHGSTGAMRLSKPVVAMARTSDGGGYWLVASDGGIFAFGDAGFYGSAANIHLAAPVVGMVPTSDGRGYWLVASDGGVFAFGDAPFAGSLGGQGVSDAVAVTPTPDDGGYLILGGNGTVYPFGDATWLGDPTTSPSGWAGRAVGLAVRG